MIGGSGQEPAGLFSQTRRSAFALFLFKRKPACKRVRRGVLSYPPCLLPLTGNISHACIKKSIQTELVLPARVVDGWPTDLIHIEPQ